MSVVRVALSKRVSGFCGFNSYVNGLVDGMKNIDDLETYIFDKYKNIGYNGLLNQLPTLPIKLYRDEISLPLFLIKNSIDVFHCTENADVPSFLPCKMVLTLHDAPLDSTPIFSDKRADIRYKKYCAKAIKFAIDKSSQIITVSERSKREIINYFGIDSNRIVVIYNGYDPTFKICDGKEIELVKRKYKIEKPFFLIVGGSQHRKNGKRILEIFTELYKGKFQLVATGEWGNIDSYNNDIIFTGMVSKKDLVSLYNGAKIFIFPSYSEGFGIPVLESMACGTPVITSNIASLPEVAGDAAIYVDPYKNSTIVSGINKILENPSLEQELIGRGFEQIKKFSYDISAKKTYDVYKSIL